MTRRRLTAAVALAGIAIGLWLALVPYDRTIRLARMEVAGRCPPAARAAFVRIPDPVFYDLADGDRLPAQLCRRSARRRLAGGVAVCLLSAAVGVAGRTTWPVRPAEM